MPHTTGPLRKGERLVLRLKLATAAATVAGNPTPSSAAFGSTPNVSFSEQLGNQEKNREQLSYAQVASSEALVKQKHTSFISARTPRQIGAQYQILNPRPEPEIQPTIRDLVRDSTPDVQHPAERALYAYLGLSRNHGPIGPPKACGCKTDRCCDACCNEKCMSSVTCSKKNLVSINGA